MYLKPQAGYISENFKTKREEEQGKGEIESVAGGGGGGQVGGG